MTWWAMQVISTVRGFSMKEVQLLAAFHKNEPLSAYWCFETGKRKTIGIQKQTENNCLLSHREFHVTLNIKLFLNLV